MEKELLLLNHRLNYLERNIEKIEEHLLNIEVILESKGLLSFSKAPQKDAVSPNQTEINFEENEKN